MNTGVLQGRRILVVEDEEMIAMLLEDYLLDCKRSFSPTFSARH